MRKLCLIALLWTLSLTGLAQVAAPKREMRAAWLHTVAVPEMADMTAEQVQARFVAALDALSAAGFNAVVFQVRPTADAFYKSDLEPWSRYLTGVQGKAPEPFWDPLQFMIEEAHKRGMELHAWLNPYRVTYAPTDSLCAEHIYFKKPDIIRQYDRRLYFDPGEPESVKHLVRVVADIVSRYDVDGIHMDDYFYPYPVRFEEFHDDASFVKYAATQGFEHWQKADWRRHNVEQMVKAVNDTIKAIKPWLRFGISPFGIHRNKKDDPTGSNTNGLSNYDELFADVPAMARKGYIDYVTPQLYWKIGHRAADYKTLFDWWSALDLGAAHLYIGQSISTMADKETKGQLRRKMDQNRKSKVVKGNFWWPSWTIADREKVGLVCITDSLEKVYHRSKALLPVYDKLDSMNPAPVDSVWVKSGRICWKVKNVKDVMQQPHFYVVYSFAPGEKADITNPKAIVAVTKNCFYQTGASNSNRKWVVTVVDRCWRESEPSKEILF
ncbi:MAG: family 10 glycosylhydrolase [Bacteroidales bacterium]|nr:family 10 glycosylhydrolase [Bacteroidales bacterium]